MEYQLRRHLYGQLLVNFLLAAQWLPLMIKLWLTVCPWLNGEIFETRTQVHKHFCKVWRRMPDAASCLLVCLVVVFFFSLKHTEYNGNIVSIMSDILSWNPPASCNWDMPIGYFLYLVMSVLIFGYMDFDPPETFFDTKTPDQKFSTKFKKDAGKI